MKYSKEIVKLQLVEEQKGKRIRGIKHPKRDKLATQCERCFKWYHETEAPDKQTIEGERIESEVVPLCPTCFKKALRKERQRQNIMNAIGEGTITETEYKKWKKKETPSKSFFEKISKGVRKLKRENVLSDAIVANENYMHTHKFKRECNKYSITVERIIEMADIKMRKIMENENEEFLENE